MPDIIKTLLGCAALGLILLTPGCSGNDPDQKKPPNVLLILVDDLGNNDIASWGDGTAPTPTLDQISKRSLRFRQHYTDSTCSVSRAALLTGRSPANIGFQPDGLALSPDLETLPKSLKALGYHTYHVGKWHVGEGIEYPGTWPLQQGFDEWFGMFNQFLLKGPTASGHWIRQKPTYTNPWLQENDQPARQYSGHLDDLLTDYAVEKIKQSDRQQPWFINLWLFSPHLPMEPSASFASRFPNTDSGRYLAVLNQLDSNVSRVLDALEASGQADNTIVVFTSDNGSPNLGRDNNWPLQGVKATFREGGVRVPLLIYWPGHYENQDITTTSSIVDIYPTLMEMITGRAPANLDGLSQATQPASGSPRALYWAADVKGFGMTYAGYLPGEGGFYRDLWGNLEQIATSSAYIDGSISRTPGSYSGSQASALIQEWERQHRPIPLIWSALSEGGSGYLSGRDFQRTPAFGPYSLGMGLHQPTPVSPMQTLVEQPLVWRLELADTGILTFIYGSTQINSDRLTWRSGCNSLVVSLSITPETQYPFNAKAASEIAIYFNGALVMSSQSTLKRPTSEQAFHQPTYIGISSSGTQPFTGTITRPELVLKYLRKAQDGYDLQAMESTVCMPADEQERNR